MQTLKKLHTYKGISDTSLEIAHAVVASIDESCYADEKLMAELVISYLTGFYGLKKDSNA